MDRKNFLKNSLGLAGVAVVAPSLFRSESTSGQVGTTPSKKNILGCSVTNSETAGPFPTISPSTLVRTNIVDGRTGVAFTMNIYIKNTNGNCGAYEGVLVDVCHCDKDGNYSEYGGTQMQKTNYTNYHFLRGRQTTDANGLVSFTSIFPGWYQSRATHIHVHIYKPNGTSLLVTQIAFPEGTNSAVYNVNVNGSSYGYTKGMTGYTYNANDNVCSDGTSNEMSTVTGSLSAGYVLTHTIYVAGALLGTDETSKNKNFTVGQSYPNPFREETVFPIVLNEASTVDIELYDISGRKMVTVINNQRLASGKQDIKISRSQLKAGMYLAKVIIENSKGRFVEDLKVMVH
ncbi:T9SS type A sorting domain-containing protein [Epilithonimonas sp.]|uniref:T9SS type A sorting domain-containing protein n=1 Tax=Epilithonimonas sp. TaxID=2894511 RepID=UPI0028AB0154|nr:T9SS type A sorting domain-containing protein [Epilithonimonas sp.]